MKLVEGLEAVQTPFDRSSVAIGTFDGVHLGHQAIIRRAVEDGRAHDRPSLVFTFDRHPLELLRPEAAPELLTTPEQRNALIAELGVDALIVARFDLTLANLSPDAFLADILKGLLGAEAIVEGANFSFGKDRAGDVAYLQHAQEAYRFTLHALEPVVVEGAPVSSTRIRERLRSGEIAAAERLLGHPYELVGQVIGGQKLGRTLGYPTANLALSYRQIAPADGIYAVTVRLDDGRELGGACSIGNRPTIEGAGRSIETYLFQRDGDDFHEDLYGRGMAIRFVRRLRAEEKFDSLQALVAQMARDVTEARNLLCIPGR
jgi:riboflavin kinase/FMN adenylyltransferase